VQTDISKDYKAVTEGYFAQTTIDLGDVGLDGLKFTAGYRHSTFKTSFLDLQTAVNPVTGIFAVPGGKVIAAKLNQGANSYNFSLDYHVSPNVLVYATTRHGYKAGGINAQQIPVNKVHNPQSRDTFDPEFVTDYEIGAKTTWTVGDIRGHANIAAFSSTFSGVQRNETFIDVDTLATIAQLNNIAGMKTRGVEFDLDASFSRAFRVSFNYSYLDAYYTAYPGCTFRFTDNVCVPNIQAAPRGTPKHKINLYGRYALPVAESVGEVALSVNASYQSEVRLSENDLADPLVESQPGYALVDLKVEWNHVMGNNVDLSLYVKNATNKYYRQGTAHVINAGLGTAAAMYGDPRTFGITARFHFGS
jgi:iron complex outermembrane recepter protein